MILKHLISRRITHSEDKKFIKDSFWNFAGSIISKMSMLIASIFTARFLGATVFGEWGVIRSTSIIFTTLLNFGVSVTTMKYLAEFRDTDKQKSSRIFSLNLISAIIFGAIISLMMFFLSGFIANIVFKKAELEYPLKISSFYLLVTTISGVFSGVLYGLDSYKKIAIANCYVGFIGAIVLISFTFLWGLKGIAYGYLIYYSINCIVYGLQLPSILKHFDISFSFRGILSEIKVLYQFSLPAMISGSIGGPVVWVSYMLVSQLENGFAIIGLYNAAKICQDAFIEIGTQINNPLITLISNIKNQRANYLSFIVPLAFVSIAILPIIFFPEIYSVFLHKSDYSGAVFNTVISIATFTAYIIVIKQSLGRVIITNNRVWIGVYENIGWSFVLLLPLVFTLNYMNSVLFSSIYLFAYIVDYLVLVPIFQKLKLINSKVFISKDLILIFILIFVGTFIQLHHFSIIYRLILYIASLLLSIHHVRKINTKLLNENTDTSI